MHQVSADSLRHILTRCHRAQVTSPSFLRQSLLRDSWRSRSGDTEQGESCLLEIQETGNNQTQGARRRREEEAAQ